MSGGPALAAGVAQLLLLARLLLQGLGLLPGVEFFLRFSFEEIADYLFPGLGWGRRVSAADPPAAAVSHKRSCFAMLLLSYEVFERMSFNSCQYAFRPLVLNHL
jgi:hypothetical protein